jgi:hypothetical protein
LARTPKKEGDRKNDTQTLCTREMSEKSSGEIWRPERTPDRTRRKGGHRP